MKRILLPFLWIALLATPASAQDPATAEARAVLDATVDAVLAALANESTTLAEKRAEITAVAYERFDFETMSKLVLKRDWKKFTATEKAEFIEAFRTYLANNYGSRLSRYNQESIDRLGEKLEKRGDVTVKTVIRGGDAEGAAIDYRLRKRDEEWRIIDVVIEGISLVGNFRSQFSDVLQKGGPRELLSRLETKNAEEQAGNAAEEI